jgi:hypothetical protein
VLRLRESIVLSMNQPDRRVAIEAWFAARGISLRYSQVGDPSSLQEWVAIMLPGDPSSGVAEGGGGLTKVAAAEDAVTRYLKRNPDVVGP